MVSVIGNVAPWSAAEVAIITHFLDQFRSTLISQLIEDISNVPQKFLRYFNGTTASTFFVLLLPVWRAIFSLFSKELLVALSALVALKLTIPPLAAKASSSLQYCYKIPGQSGIRTPGSQDPGTQDPGPPSKFESGTQHPP